MWCLGSRKVNGVAEVRLSFPWWSFALIQGVQLHSELVRTTILKDFVEFEGPSKLVSSFDIIYTASTSLIVLSKDLVTSLTAVSLKPLPRRRLSLIYPLQVTPRRWLDQVPLSQNIPYYNRWTQAGSATLSSALSFPRRWNWTRVFGSKISLNLKVSWSSYQMQIFVPNGLRSNSATRSDWHIMFGSPLVWS